MATVVIDPGHDGSETVGGSSPNNATGPSGTMEKTLTLDLGLKTQKFLLAQGVTVLLTRENDTNIGIADRVLVAKNAAAHAFLSIHFNGDTNPAIQGTETWISNTVKNDSISNKFAREVQEKVVAVTGYRDRGIKAETPDVSGVLDPGDHYFETAVCLVEISFLTNPADEKRLTAVELDLGEKYRMQLAEALSLAAFDHLRSRALI
jgi:N-acetylmuramoyl-L-alanine amidase